MIPGVVQSSAWLLFCDRAGSGPIHESECTSCLEGSGPADDEAAPAMWSLRHARRTGHTGYRRVITHFQRALECSVGTRPHNDEETTMTGKHGGGTGSGQGGSQQDDSQSGAKHGGGGSDEGGNTSDGSGPASGE